MNHRGGNLLQRDLRRHQRSKGCDHGLRLSLYNFSERLHTFRHKLVAMDIRLIENKILRRIPGHFPVIKLIILKDLPGLQITESNDDFISKTIAESIGHMKLLGIHAACKADAGSRFFRSACPSSNSASSRNGAVIAFIYFSPPARFPLNLFMASSGPFSIMVTAASTAAAMHSSIILRSPPVKCPST